MAEKHVDSVVNSAIEGAGLFYAVRFEPIPSKTCFDVSLKTYAPPHSEYVVTVNIPKGYPMAPPAIFCKKDPKLKFKFLDKQQWKPSMGIKEVLIEACHVVSRRDLSSRLPILPSLRPPFQKNRGSRESRSPRKSAEKLN
ncbi:hypothetical protein B9Z55_003508 [Caenorhabditis nigoni]|uniref:UBC core domain-containing protein n=1 Tax=Caenorhabditis nigoni TaxID=1611254 RepID=A0A2G5VQL1_9PELO|nr:hypothetical protein B9Z55_003508 [Caenorhabditis nigoni]